MKPKRIFITGIAGFIGFHLARLLKARGDFVCGLDSFNSYYDPALKRARADLLEKEGILVFDRDFTEKGCLDAYLAEYRISHLVHLAAYAGVRNSIKHPEEYLRTNVDGFWQILETCRRHPHIPLTYASSSSVYGLNEKTPFSEEDKTDQPASFYGATKKANELMAHAYHHLYGIRVTGLRFFTVYGPWGRPDMAYYTFTKAIVEGKAVEVFNQGQMRRDFTYIDDIVHGSAAAIDLEAACEIFNLGHHHPEEVLDLIKIIEELTGKQAVIHYVPMQSGDVTITYADITKSQKALGFYPKTSLKEGMKQFVTWYVVHHFKSL